ncbi:hypothetical protein DCAR_0100796 [Daucus carota subsp. sativus]|uniref:Uncharacterized protein n=1 Tax=Daucus carota subsp. sativus TaxID=79200 RepID=A0A161ZZW8_DAUCS|nr:hypothetical protein DCAR_0100796 [Daucus carota subsp. sativus]
MSVQLKKGSSLVDLYDINRGLLKKPPLKKRTKHHNSCGAPKCSTKLVNPERGSKRFLKWEMGKFFVAVLKILFVSAVALMTKRMVLGATVSAFCLFFLEYGGRFLYRLMRGLLICRTKKTSVSFTRTEWDSSEGGFVSGCSSLTVSSEEVCDIPADLDMCFSDFTNSDSNKKLEFEDRGSGEGILVSDQNCNCDGLGTKSRGSRRERVKSKMKKLVPKKIKRSMKKRSAVKRGGTDVLEDDNCEAKEYDTEVDASDDSEDSDVEAKAEKARDVRRFISKYWFLCFIALAGLFQGRSLAVVLTLFWCLIVKLVECTIKHRKLS